MLRPEKSVKAFFALSKRVSLAARIGDKIGPARKHFADGADHRGDMLDTVHDLFPVVQKDDVAVLAHELDDQRVAAEVAHLVEVFHCKTQDPLEAGLRHRVDAAVLQVFAQEHAESRRLKRGLSLFGREISQREGGVCREIEPALAPAALGGRFECKDQFVAVRLRYFVYSGARKSVGEFLAETGGRDSVKSHKTRLLSLCCGFRVQII